jgi:hypothetical protein
MWLFLQFLHTNLISKFEILTRIQNNTERCSEQPFKSQKNDVPPTGFLLNKKNKKMSHCLFDFIY